jgi:hypothetical protein
MRRFNPVKAMTFSVRTINHCASTDIVQLNKAAKYNYLRTNLRTRNLSHIPKATFLKECVHVGLNPEEADECLTRFANAGIVVSGPDGIFLKPAAVLADCQEAMGLCKESYDVAAPLRAELAALREELAELDKKKMILDAKAGSRRKLWWGMAAFYSGFQMYVMSRFTFVDFDWDIMEPVSFFLTTGTALVFFVWYLIQKKEHTYTRYDLTMLPRRLRKLYSSAGFDYTRWKAIHTRMAELEEELAKTEEWKAING